MGKWARKSVLAIWSPLCLRSLVSGSEATCARVWLTELSILTEVSDSVGMKEDFDPAYPKVLFLVCKWYGKVEDIAHRMVSLYPHTLELGSVDCQGGRLTALHSLPGLIPACRGG